MNLRAFVLILLFFLFGVSPVYAFPIDFYEKIFDGWGVGVKTVPVSNRWDTVNFLIMPTSELDKGEILDKSFGFQNIFIICNEEWEYRDIKCSYDTLVFKEEYEIVTFADNTVEGMYTPKMLVYRDQNINTFFIPEINMLIPSYRSNMSGYFKEIGDSQRLLEDSVLLVVDLRFWDRLNLSAFLLESTFYILSILLFVYVFKGFLGTLFTNPNDVLKLKYSQRMKNFTVSAYRAVYPLALSVFVISIPSMFGLLALISFIDLGRIDVGYMASVFGEILDMRLATFYIEEMIWGRFIVILMLMIIISSFVFINLNNIVSDLLGFVPWVKRPMKLGFKKYVIPVLVFILFYSVLAFGLERSYILISFILVILAYIVWISRFNIDFLYSYSSMEKRYFGLFAVLGIVAILLSFYMFRYEKEVSYVNLFPQGKEYVVLPYYARFDGEKLFDRELVSSEYPIFVDNMLVFYPGFESVVYADVGKFNSNLPGMVILKEREEEFVNRLVLDDSTRRRIVVDNRITRYVYLGEANLRENFNIYLRFDCTDDLEVEDVNVTVYSHRFVDEFSVFTFPGCYKDRQEYRIPLLGYTGGLGRYILSIKGVEEKSLRRVRFESGGEFIDFSYLNLRSDDGYLYLDNVKDEDGETVYFYMDKETGLKITSDKRVIALGDSINKLYLNRLIKRDFVIRSNRHYIELRRFYD